MTDTSFVSQTFECNGQAIHAKLAGAEDAPVMVMLHGFPEYWVAWSKVAEKLMNRFTVVLPDQRGFHKSGKPSGVEAYETRHMVTDLLDLINQVSPEKPVILCGHDWGASVAYAFAMRNPDRISHLVIANGVHPVCFQKALYAAGPQTKASQYMNLLKEANSEERMRRDNFSPLLNMFRKFSAAPWLTREKEATYIDSWSRPDALTNMLNWYRSSPMVVPGIDEPARDFEITPGMREKYQIIPPHLLIWGEKDSALLPETWEDLHLFCNDLTVETIPDASHWILHENPGKVANLISGFLEQHQVPE